MIKHHQNIIIGAGIAGLYLATKLKDLGQSYFIIEKNEYIGGRALWKDFHGNRVTMGAGVIRSTDLNVIALCKKLNLELIGFESKFNLHPELNIDQNIFPQMLSELKNTYDKLFESDLARLQKITFDEFLLTEFTPEFNRIFRMSVIYTDFFNASVIDTMKYYPYTDLLPKSSHVYTIKGGWSKLLDSLTNQLDSNRIKLNSFVDKINSKNNLIKTNSDSYTYDNLFICTDISILDIDLELPTELKITLNNIGSVEFIRAYSYHDNPHNINTTTITPSILHKLIPITDKILMVAYADSNKAKYLNNLLSDLNVSDQINLITKYFLDTAQAITTSSNISDIVWKYWKHGIHYFKPHNNTILLSKSNINLIGEFVSNNQGWVEGAIESVNDFIRTYKLSIDNEF